MTKPDLRRLSIAALSAALLVACGDDTEGICIADCDGGVDGGADDPAPREVVSLDRLECPWFIRGGMRGTWHATLLTPLTTPFDVELVRYAAQASPATAEFPACESHLVERVALLRTTEIGLPPDALAPDREVDAPQGGDEGTTQNREVEIDPPLRVEAGESVYVLIRTGADSDAVGCLGSCEVTATDAPRSTSAVAVEPLDWQTVTERLGGPGDPPFYDGYNVSIVGRPTGG